MTKPPYTPAPFRGTPLVAFIQMILQSSASAFEARGSLTDLLESEDIEISPALPPLWRVRPLADGGLGVEGPDGPLDTTRIFVSLRTAPGRIRLTAAERAAIDASPARLRTLAALARARVKEEPQAIPVDVEAQQQPPAQDNEVCAQPEPPKTDAESPPATVPSSVRKLPLPVWLQTVERHFDDAFKRNGPYPSLGSLRDAIKIVLGDKEKPVPEDRTIERGLTTHRPTWFINRGT